MSNPVVTFRMPPALLATFDARLAQLGLSRTTALNRLVEGWLKGLIPLPTRPLTVEDPPWEGPS